MSRVLGRGARTALAVGACWLASVLVLPGEADPSADFNFSLLAPANAQTPSMLTEQELARLLGERLDVFPKSQLPRLSAHLLALCRKYRFDPSLILAVIQVESSFRVRAQSPVGARGLMQLMPETAEFVARRFGVPYSGERALLDPYTNLALGVAYLSHLRERYWSQSPYFQFAAYNMGPGRLDYLRRTRGRQFRPTGTKQYYEAILANVPVLRRNSSRKDRPFFPRPHAGRPHRGI